MDCTRRTLAWMSIILATSPLVALAQLQPGGADPPRQQPGEQPRELQVVATVNGAPITQGEVQATLQPQLQGREVDPQIAAQLQKQVVDNLIESRLVEQYALKKGPGVEEQEVDAVIDRFKGQLAEQDLALDQFLVSRGHTPDTFEERIKGSLAWQKFQQQQVTDEKLEQYFQANQQRFDAESFQEARQEVANAYVGELWKQIVGQMKPDAEIRGAAAPRPAPQPPNQQPPRRSVP